MPSGQPVEYGGKVCRFIPRGLGIKRGRCPSARWFSDHAFYRCGYGARQLL